MIDQNLTQRAFTTILEHFVAKGRAPHYAELADALDVASEEAREVQRAAVEAAPIASCWLAHDGFHRVLGAFQQCSNALPDQRPRHSEVVRPVRDGVAGRALALPWARGCGRFQMPRLWWIDPPADARRGDPEDRSANGSRIYAVTVRRIESWFRGVQLSTHESLPVGRAPHAVASPLARRQRLRAVRGRVGQGLQRADVPETPRARLLGPRSRVSRGVPTSPSGSG